MRVRQPVNLRPSMLTEADRIRTIAAIEAKAGRGAEAQPRLERYDQGGHGSQADGNDR